MHTQQKRWSWLGGLTFGVATVVGLQGPVVGQTMPGEETDAAALAAQQYEQERLAAIDADRQGVVQQLAEKWASASGESAEDLAQVILYNTSGHDLLALQGATSFDQVKGILAGESSDGSVAALTLGDLNEDLVFTPVTPCRVVDTRFAAGGAIPANGFRNFNVHGSGVTIGGQGGNPAGCTAPQGEPRGVHLNVTVVPVSGNGFVKVYPYLTAEPNASLVNFKQGTNIANASSLKTCYLCGPEIRVKSSKLAHVIIDVLGYYYPAKLVAERRELATEVVTGTAFQNIGSITIAHPGPGTIVVRASGYIVSLASDSVSQFGIGTNTSSILRGVWGGLDGAGIGSSDLYTPAYDEQHFSVSGSGSKTYYLNTRLWTFAQAANSNIRLPILTAQYIPE